jgi:hypothetical protein
MLALVIGLSYPEYIFTFTPPQLPSACPIAISLNLCETQQNHLGTLEWLPGSVSNRLPIVSHDSC